MPTLLDSPLSTMTSDSTAFGGDPLRRSLCIKEVMTALGVARKTVYNWITAGKVEYFRTPGGAIRIYADSLVKRGSR